MNFFQRMMAALQRFMTGCYGGKMCIRDRLYGFL